jgi:uncharacterized membrane-anchored protein YitT (DUF2179 family)
MENLELYQKQNQALNVLVEAVKYAQLKGTYTLEQAEVIISALKIFELEQEVNEQNAQPESDG